jgi:hypothetical protein
MSIRTPAISRELYRQVANKIGKSNLSIVRKFLQITLRPVVDIRE